MDDGQMAGGDKQSFKLRSADWFNDPTEPSMTALYSERYFNYGFTVNELQSDRPIIGVVQTGSDLVPCNRYHIELAKRVKEGVRDAGGTPLEFPVHPIQETGRRPTAALDRNLQCLSLIEVLHGYPIDGVVLMTGCDKTTVALLMAAASVDLPSICISVGPMLNGYHRGRAIGSGTSIWEARRQLAEGKIDRQAVMEMAVGSAPSAGHCNTMGTALTLNCLAEALGMALPGSAAIPAPYRERQHMAYITGRRAVEMVWEQLTPSKILTQQAFQNAIVVCGAIGGSSNAPIHINAIARHAGVPLSMENWRQAQDVPQIVNCQPVGEYLSEEFHRAGGVAAVISELLKEKMLDQNPLTVAGGTVGGAYRGMEILDSRVIRSVDNPIRRAAGFMVMTGNLFESAIMKVSAISDEFKRRHLSDESDPNAFEGKAVVFDGPEDYRARIDDPDLMIDEGCILVMRGAGPKAYPGSAEVVNMQPPAALIKKGVSALPTIGDGRQSGTSAAASILNASPEAAVGGGLAALRTGDRIRVDLNTQQVNVMLSDAEMRQRLDGLKYAIPEHQTWWQQIHREYVTQLSEGAVFKGMAEYRNIASKKPRHSH